MPTTLTKEMLKERSKPRYEEVPVEGFGTIGLRSVSPVKLSHRQSQMMDGDGELLDDEFHMRDVYSIIDQCMVDEDTPMFSEEDKEWLQVADVMRLRPLLSALNTFNGATKKKGTSGDTSES